MEVSVLSLPPSTLKSDQKKTHVQGWAPVWGFRIRALGTLSQMLMQFTEHERAWSPAPAGTAAVMQKSAHGRA